MPHDRRTSSAEDAAVAHPVPAGGAGGAGPSSPHLRRSRTAKLEHGSPPTQQAPDRRCSAPGCATVLSRYNPSGTCARHAGWRDT